jgi:Ca-activated chloride channel family protein
MSFAAPIWLAVLALVPLGIAAMVIARRRADRYAVRFPAVSTAKLASGVGRSWTRHLPAAAVLAALAALGVALARPRVDYTASVRAASVMLVSDESGSMAATDVQPTRLGAAERAADNFIDHLPSSARVGAIAFSSAANAVQAPVTDHRGARAVIDGQSPQGGTATGTALQLALQMLGGAGTRHPASAVVLLSDGAANLGPDPILVAHQAAAYRIPIYTVALGTPGGTIPNPDPFGSPLAVPPDPQLMQQIASASHGRSFTAHSADELDSIYNLLGTHLGSVTRRRDITALFVGGGAALLLLCFAAAARWSPKLP